MNIDLKDLVNLRLMNKGNPVKRCARLMAGDNEQAANNTTATRPVSLPLHICYLSIQTVS